jgi:hypothetical protein
MINIVAYENNKIQLEYINILIIHFKCNGLHLQSTPTFSDLSKTEEKHVYVQLIF